MDKLKAIIVGAGSRGTLYTKIMLEMPEKYEVIAVADPIEGRRKQIQSLCNLPDEMCFADWRPLLALGKIADIAVIATMDRDHTEPTMKAIELKYDILLEKPISPEPAECKRIAEAAEKNGVKIVVCHVLRYTPFFRTLKKIIDDGRIGDIISVNHEECVGDRHQSHSFVRGNWGNSQRSSFMLLQKSCHDIDILQWLIGKKCKKVQSFGSLTYFTEKNAPAGSPQYCLEGCPAEETCPYHAGKIYLEGKYWFKNKCTKEPNPTDEMKREALMTTQFGKCIFKCDNDVVDHQTVNMLFEDDITVTFTMCAFNKGGRFIHIMGTKGEVYGDMNASLVELYDFMTETKVQVPVDSVEDALGGHGGGDVWIVKTLYDYVKGIDKDPSISEARISYENHMIVFAAEDARKNGTIIDMDAYEAQL